MNYELSGKRAFITGSSKGIGKATALLLHREGGAALRADGGVVKAAF